MPDQERRIDQKVLTLLDETLNSVAMKVQRHQKYHGRNQEWRDELSKLQKWVQFILYDVENSEIQALIKPFFPNIQNINSQIQKAIYDEACSKVLKYIPNNIKQWNNTHKNFREWVIDDLLKGNFLEEAVTENLDLLQENSSLLIVSVDELDNVISSENFLHQLYYEEFIKAINKIYVFKKTRLRERPEISFKWLLLERIKGRSWQDISTEVDIKIGTLSSFYSRSLNKFKYLFNELL